MVYRHKHYRKKLRAPLVLWKWMFDLPEVWMLRFCKENGRNRMVLAARKSKLRVLMYRKGRISAGKQNSCQEMQT